MNFMWSLSIDDILEVYDRAKKDCIQPGQSIEKYFLEYAKEKNIKPLGATELTKEEMINEATSHGKNVLNIEVNSDGDTKYKFDQQADAGGNQYYEVEYDNTLFTSFYHPSRLYLNTDEQTQTLIKNSKSFSKENRFTAFLMSFEGSACNQHFFTSRILSHIPGI